jgi:peroxiredoxin
VRRIAQLRERFDWIQDHALDVLVVLCQKRENVVRWVVKHPIPFPVLVDDDRSRAKRWGVYVYFSYDAINIARSSSFVVDRYGIVRYARLARHQMDHAPLDGILAAAGSPDPP